MSELTGDGALLQAIQSGESLTDEQLLAAYDELDAVDVDFMLGTWRGGVFHHDHHFGRMLLELNWYGKHFGGVDDVQPLLVTTEGGEIDSYEKFGLARLRELSFRGVVSVAMLYDNQPLIDHFRRVSDDVVIGLADEKGRPCTYFFHLTRA